jgi:hypothetical protein
MENSRRLLTVNNKSEYHLMVFLSTVRRFQLIPGFYDPSDAMADSGFAVHTSYGRLLACLFKGSNCLDLDTGADILSVYLQPSCDDSQTDIAIRHFDSPHTAVQARRCRPWESKNIPEKADFLLVWADKKGVRDVKNKT